MDIILQTERQALRFRLAVILVTAAGLYLSRLEAWLPAVLLVLVYMSYVVLLRAFLLPRLPLPWAVYGMIAVDVAAVSLGILLGSRLDTLLFVLLPALILYYSIHLGYASSLAAATASSLAYSTVALATGEAEWLGAFLGFQVPLFYLLALMGGFLSQKRIEERRERESLQEAIGLERGARSLLEVTKALSNTLDVHTVLEHVLSSAMALMDMKAGMVALPKRGNGPLEVRAATLKRGELGFGEMGQAAEAPQEGSPTFQALQALEPQWVPDLRGEELGVPLWLRALPYPSLLVTPLAHNGRGLGVLYLLGQALRPGGLAQAKSLGELAGMALANATLHEESQTRITDLREQFEELVGRVERLRQAQRKKAIQVEELRIDLVKGQVAVEGKEVKLSPIEFDLLSRLAENAGEALTHDTLLRLVWGPEYEGRPNVVDVSIHRLRRKIERDTTHPQRIVTVRGVGYMLSSGSKRPTVAASSVDGSARPGD